MTELEILQANSDEWKRHAIQYSGELDGERRKIIALEARLAAAVTVCKAWENYESVCLPLTDPQRDGEAEAGAFARCSVAYAEYLSETRDGAT
jgi:hypothetical protein